ncbi:MAG TPA: molecular chaperone DnaJ [Polyangia bacterium]|nr:molecular chaperone DnaJ [Polyangia bacterium]
MSASAHKRDYYELLGVARDATNDELKAAFRRLAVQYHPDRNPGDRGAEEKFKEVAAAYAILSDPDKRARYDRFGADGAGDPFAGGFPFASVQDLFSGLFGEIFGGAARKRGAQGRDLRYTLEVSFEEAAFGCQKNISFQTRETCRACTGSGARGAARGLKPCPTCGGRGEIRVRQGFFSLGKTCGACGGQGKLVADPCPECKGQGTLPREREFLVKIPPGSADGGVRMVRGQGEAGRRGSPPGDLHVFVRVAPHPLFERQGDDVVCEVPLTFPQAALGTHIEVPTLDGKVKMKVPPGTQSGRVFRLRGKGIPRAGGVRGDQHVRVLVETPTQLTPRERELLEAFAKECGLGATPKSKSFFDKVKELLGE